MEMGRTGVWFPTNGLTKPQLAELATGVERLNYDVLWYPESLSYESLSLAGFMLGVTKKLAVGSGIANIYARDALTAMAGHNTLNCLYDDRFVLGLGVSHIPLVEAQRGHNYGKPVSTMRAYLDAMDSAQIAITPPSRNVVLAALGPNMLALSRDETKGALPYCVTPEHTAMAKEILGDDKWLCVEQKVCMTTDVGKAKDVIAESMSRYLALPNYRNNWLRLGFSEDELSGHGSDGFLDAMVVSGDADAIKSRLKAHYDAGANHVCIQPVNPDGSTAPDWDALEALAPGGA
jgi:probable F420-dependent oxidoreductase